MSIVIVPAAPPIQAGTGCQSVVRVCVGGGRDWQRAEVLSVSQSILPVPLNPPGRQRHPPFEQSRRQTHTSTNTPSNDTDYHSIQPSCMYVCVHVCMYVCVCVCLSVYLSLSLFYSISLSISKIKKTGINSQHPPLGLSFVPSLPPSLSLFLQNDH